MRTNVKVTNKKEKGITLIALVVTIVVLLILAGASISFVLGSDGIITKAKEATAKEQIEAIREAREIYDTEKSIEATDENLGDYLYKRGLITEEEKEIVKNGGKITRGNYSIEFDKVKTLVEAFKDGDIKVGDYMDYRNPSTISDEVKKSDPENYTDTEYTSPSSTSGCHDDQKFSLENNGNTVKWQVLGLNEDETQLMLISTGLTPDNKDEYGYELGGAKAVSKEYGLKELDKISAIYKNEFATEVRSLTINDVNRLCNVKADIDGKKVTKVSDESKNIDKLGMIGTTKTYENQFESPEDYIEDSTYSGTTESFSKKSDMYSYDLSDAIDNKTQLYQMLSRGGWLASSAVGLKEYYCYWGVGCIFNKDVYSGLNAEMFESDDGDPVKISVSVAAVAVLKADVTINDIEKVK